MFKNFLSQELVQEIIDKLLPLYPDNAEKATDILLKEYELTTNIAYLLMTIVQIKKLQEQIMCWPLFDVSYTAFGLN